MDAIAWLLASVIVPIICACIGGVGPLLVSALTLYPDETRWHVHFWIVVPLLKWELKRAQASYADLEHRGHMGFVIEGQYGGELMKAYMRVQRAEKRLMKYRHLIIDRPT